MNESILNTIKRMLGLESDYRVFDQDIMVGINSALSNVWQIGALGDPVSITSESDTWTSLGLPPQLLPFAKEYVYLRTRMVFDPPSSSQAANAFSERASELEWRLYAEQ